jgi:DNA-binding CsgD family transcriptional regulator
VDLSYQSYDAVLGALYGANRSERGIGGFVVGLQTVIDADMASLSVYDATGGRVSHGVCTNHHAVSSRRIESWQRDAEMSRLIHHRFSTPVRLSELAPYANLVDAAWYRAQFLDLGLRHCMFQDVAFGTSKIRIVAQRSGRKPEFGHAELDLFSRVGRHVANAEALLSAAAFTNAARCPEVQTFDLDDRMRLGASRQARDLQTILRDQHRLTPAEVRVAAACMRGEALQTVAMNLNLSVNTVKVHLRHIYSKLDVRRLSELVSRLGGMAR